MRLFIRIFAIALFIFSSKIISFASPYSSLFKVFNIFSNLYEGETGFNSLLIHPGGRIAGLNGAFTALSNDITFFETNPAGSATLKNTELAFFHNAWIADSHLDTISYSMRSGNLGYGSSLRCFYVPFTEYGFYGERLSSGYYSETFAIFNIAYNLFKGYKFKGISLGANIKFGITSFPPFQGQNAKEDILSPKMRRLNAKAQMSFAFLADFGIQFRWDFLKKFSSREPNVFLGLAIKNIGPPIKNEIAPATASLGFAYRPFKVFTFSLDASYPINILNFKRSGKPFFATGFMFGITKYFNLLTGFGVRGGNPRFTLGGEVNFLNVQITANYTLDLTTQTTALNHIILGAKIILGDRGRGLQEDKIEKMYLEGLKLYQEKEYENAIKIWEEILSLNPRFTPAKDSIRSAKNMLLLQTELLKLDQSDW